MKGNSRIPVDKYLEHALRFSRKEVCISRDLMKWLPAEIVDAHVHCGLPEHVKRLEDEIFRHVISTFPFFSLEHSKSLDEHFYPGKAVRKLRFPMPYSGIDLVAANAYLENEAQGGDRIALAGIPDDSEYTTRMLRTRKFAALKMYYLYQVPPKRKIYEVFPLCVLEETQALGVPIILHLPLPITQSLSDLLRLQRDFPRIKVVLSHLGVAHLPSKELAGVYREAAKHPGTFMDTAMIASSEVVRLALGSFGTERILFGSDEPLSVIRCASYKNPHLGPRLVTDYPYHWADRTEQEQYAALFPELIHAHWSSLEAIREAVCVSQKEGEKSTKERIFRGNSKNLYGF